jgi:chorismate mutase
MLYKELLTENILDEDGIVSAVFSVTADLDAQNPCTALRRAGLACGTPLFAVQEAAVQDSLPRVIRILVHCYLNEGAVIRHVYRNGAESLRPDRKG